jgi:hypothetical protein
MITALPLVGQEKGKLNARRSCREARDYHAIRHMSKVTIADGIALRPGNAGEVFHFDAITDFW